MDASEGSTLLVCSAVTLLGAVHWYAPLVRLNRLGRSWSITAVVAVVPPACLAALLVVLQRAADPHVRGHPGYLVLFLAAGGAWLAATAAGLPVVLGVSVRDDALDRRNGPAAAVACGMLVAVTAVFAGANVGTGDTIWTTLGPAAAAAAALAGVALCHAAASGLPESVTVDRDPAAAARAVGLHLAVGLLLARAVAGDWASSDALWVDLARRGWPAVPLAAVAVAVDHHRRRRPWDRRRAVGPALAAAVAYLAVAGLIVGRGSWT